MKLQCCLLLLGVLVAVTSAGTRKDFATRSAFKRFVQDFGKKYRTATEYEKRLSIFAENLEKIERHNAQTGKSWEMGVNKFTDLTEEEFRTTYASGYINTVKNENSGAVRSGSMKSFNVSDLPSSIDWRDHGVISAPKDQGACGSCWAFATVQQLESYLKLATGNDLEPLSTQQITSCVPNPLHCGGTGGCFGSIPQLGYSYAQLFGVVREVDYPYDSGSLQITGDCKFDSESMESSVFVRGYETLPHNNLEAVLHHIANVGPLAVSVDASAWSFYFGGVFDSCDYAENMNINHAVQLVGYGTDEKHGDYWLVRNSWGPSWGENGYIRLKRESTEECGLNSTPEMGTQCQGDGNNVHKTCGMCGILFDTSYPIGADSINGIRP